MAASAISSNFLSDVLSTLRQSIPPLSSLRDPWGAWLERDEDTQEVNPSARCLDLGDGRLTRGAIFKPRELTALKVLRLHENDLASIQYTTLEALSGLTWLELHRNDLSTLPSSISRLTSLEGLTLSDNSLSSLPSSLSQLTRLKHLTLARNCAKSLDSEQHDDREACADTFFPPELSSLGHSLTTLDLSGNTMGVVPTALLHMHAMLRLNLADNGISAMPVNIFVAMPGLTDLDISVNSLKALPPSVSLLTRLTRLNIEKNEIQTLPPLSVLRALHTVCAASNKLKAFPALAGSIRTLDLSQNSLSDMPTDTFRHLTCLEILDLSDNKLVSLPTSISPRGALTCMRINNNELTTVDWLDASKCSAALLRLETVEAASNRIASLPAKFVDMPLLKCLDLHNNALVSLSPGLAKLSSLTDLGVGCNRLTSVPEAMTSLLVLSRLDVAGNDGLSLENLPEGLVQAAVAREENWIGLCTPSRGALHEGKREARLSRGSPSKGSVGRGERRKGRGFIAPFLMANEQTNVLASEGEVGRRSSEKLARASMSSVGKLQERSMPDNGDRDRDNRATW